MLYALDKNKEKVTATPTSVATCSFCQSEVVPKCGDINIWHWAHKADDCDPWSEGETLWHLSWKLRAITDFTEVVIGNHRADIFNGVLVIELQNSPISPAEIQEREQHYKNMIWLINSKDFFHNFYTVSGKRLDGLSYFGWKWARKSWRFASKKIFLDMGNGQIYEIIDWKRPNRGLVKIHSIDDFIKIYFKVILKDGKEKMVINSVL